MTVVALDPTTNQDDNHGNLNNHSIEQGLAECHTVIQIVSQMLDETQDPVEVLVLKKAKDFAQERRLILENLIAVVELMQYPETVLELIQAMENREAQIQVLKTTFYQSQGLSQTLMDAVGLALCAGEKLVLTQDWIRLADPTLDM